jgi:hypothetical protein
MPIRTGVEVTTALSAGRRTTGVASARYHIAGVTERGPVGVAQRVTSPAEFEMYFGGRTPKSEKTYNDVLSFFAERGSEAFVTRVVGPNATKGTVSLLDTAGIATLRITLNEPGPHSLNAEIEVEAGANDTYGVKLYRDGILAAQWVGMSTPADFLSRTLGHPLITVADLGSTTASPGNRPAATEGRSAFSEGTDDFAGILATHYITALDETGDSTRGGSVAVPDLPLDIIGEALIGHAVAFQKTAILTGEVDTTADEIRTAARDLVSIDGSDHAGVFWPYLVLQDQDGGARYVAPSGYVAAARARAHNQTGFWQIPAGERSNAQVITGLRFPCDTRKNNELAEDYVSGIITDAGNVKLYNWWSLSPDRANFQYLSVRDLLNNISMDLASEYRRFVFSTWDTRGKLINQIKSATKGYLAVLSSLDAVAPKFDAVTGRKLDDGYTINVDAPSGPFVEQNVILVRVEVRSAQTAQLILAEVVKVPLDAAL